MFGRVYGVPRTAGKPSETEADPEGASRLTRLVTASYDGKLHVLGRPACLHRHFHARTGQHQRQLARLHRVSVHQQGDLHIVDRGELEVLGQAEQVHVRNDVVHAVVLRDTAGTDLADGGRIAAGDIGAAAHVQVGGKLVVDGVGDLLQQLVVQQADEAVERLLHVLPAGFRGGLAELPERGTE